MTDSIPITPTRAFRTTLRPPGSKSLTNRALLLAALADGESALDHPLNADDTRRMIAALDALGFQPRAHDGGANITITGAGGTIPVRSAQLNLGNAGTAMRPLAAACGLGHGVYELDGVARMRQRPIGELVDPLRELGANVQYISKPGYPPIRVCGGQFTGSALRMQPTQSSQFISALLMIGPCLLDGLTIEFDGPVTSRPYVEMTCALMQQFGAEVSVDDAFTRIVVAPGGYRAIEYDVEPDASSASYFLAAAAVVSNDGASKCTIDGLGFRSLQGDVWFADRVLQPMGASVLYEPDSVTVMSPPVGERLSGIDIDMNEMPDMALTLAAVAVLADGPTVIRNVGNLRVKETDRLAALQTELTKLGADVSIDHDNLHIPPPPGGNITPAAIDTYDDHRIAMSFTIVGLATDGVTINNPRCVDKTYPTFFDDIAQLVGTAAQDD